MAMEIDLLVSRISEQFGKCGFGHGRWERQRGKRIAGSVSLFSKFMPVNFLTQYKLNQV